MNDLVIATLIAGPLAAGQGGYIGVHYEIEPGWHIYWDNPGESGIPTEVNLTLPPGLQADATLYPGPHRFMMPGDLINYGYEDKTTLLIPVTAAAAPSGTITASTRWLVCSEEQCIPGRASLTLDLPAEASDLQAALGHIPGPLPENATIERSEQGAHVTIPGAEIADIFPNEALQPALLQTAAHGEHARIWLKASPGDESALTLHASINGEDRFYTLDL